MSARENGTAKRPVFSKRGKRILTPPGSKTSKTLPGSKMKTARPPQIILDPGRDYGPAMSKLTDNRKRFVMAFVQTCGRSPKLAAELAGIGGSPQNAAAEACHLMRSELILDAIREVTDAMFRGTTIEAHHGVLDIARDTNNSAKVRLDAWTKLLGWGGMGITQQFLVTHKDILDDKTGEQLEALVREFRAKHPLPEIEYKPELPVLEVRESEHTENRISGEDAENRILDGDFVELQEAA